MRRGVIVVIVIVVVAAAGVVAWLASRDDGNTTTGKCEGNSYELSVENEDGGLELSFELQASEPGQSWQILVEQDGMPIYEGSRVTDEDADLDVDVPAEEDDGDEFVVTALPADGEACLARVTR